MEYFFSSFSRKGPFSIKKEYKNTMSRTLHMPSRLREKLLAVICCIPVAILITGKAYSITAAKSTKVSKIPIEYFPLILIILIPSIVNLEFYTLTL